LESLKQTKLTLFTTSLLLAILFYFSEHNLYSQSEARTDGKQTYLSNQQEIAVPPRNKWAVWFDQEMEPIGFHFRGNIFHPGTKGISNKTLNP
jgi:hypothetical protein